MVKTTFYDVVYDDATQDLGFTGGDLTAFVSSHEDHLTQLLKDAFESQFASMKHIMRGWGFQGRTYDYTVANNVPKQEMYMYVAEMMVPLGFLMTNIKAGSPTFVAPGFTWRLEATLDDLRQTSYDHTVTFNSTTYRATVS